MRNKSIQKTRIEQKDIPVTQSNMYKTIKNQLKAWLIGSVFREAAPQTWTILTHSSSDFGFN